MYPSMSSKRVVLGDAMESLRMPMDKDLCKIVSSLACQYSSTVENLQKLAVMASAWLFEQGNQAKSVGLKVSNKAKLL